MRHFDFIIVGQGLAGSVLAMTCLHVKKSVLVIDQGIYNSASRVAAGLFNPVTGRLMNKTWMADDIFPFLVDFYTQIEDKLKARFFYSVPIYRPFISIEEQNDWQGKFNTEMYRKFVSRIETHPAQIPHVIDPFGGIWLQQCGYLDTNAFLDAILDYLKLGGIFLTEKFDFDALVFLNNSISYKDVTADKIIFCEGTGVQNNPFWSHLKFKPVKGEVIKVRADLPKNVIINKNVFCVPLKDHFKIGSTYRHNDTNDLPSDQGVIEIISQMKKWYGGTLDLLDVKAGWRPATYDRKPYVGMHPYFHNLGIFNGLGTKGVSLAPYFAFKLINHLIRNETMIPDVNVMR